MKRILPALLLSALAFPVQASPFKAPNCQVKSPPAEAGGDLSHGAVVKVFPRRGTAGANYSGCQASWTSDKGQWSLLGVALFENGRPTAFWIPPPGELTCRYRDGKALGAKPRNCPPAAQLSVRSMPAGCIEKIIGRGGREGCEYD